MKSHFEPLEGNNEFFWKLVMNGSCWLGCWCPISRYAGHIAAVFFSDANVCKGEGSSQNFKTGIAAILPHDESKLFRPTTGILAWSDVVVVKLTLFNQLETVAYVESVRITFSQCADAHRKSRCIGICKDM